MILLVIINFISSLENWLFLHLFSFAIPTLNSLTTWITGISVPQTILNMYSLCACFLPLSLIRILLFLTFNIILIKLFFSLIHFLTLGILFKS